MGLRRLIRMRNRRPGEKVSIPCPNCDGEGIDTFKQDGKCEDCSGTGKVEAIVQKGLK